MQQKKVTALQFKKVTLTDLNKKEMEHIKGGDDDPKLTTITPVYCNP